MPYYSLTRRSLLKMIFHSIALCVAPFSNVMAEKNSKIVILGGGAAGNVLAKYLNRLNSSYDITIIEKNRTYHSAFMSNQLFNGLILPDKLRFDHSLMAKKGIKIVNEEVVGIDKSNNQLITHSNKKIGYDKLIIATGSQANLAKLEGLTPELINHFAWTNSNDVNSLVDAVKNLKPNGRMVVCISDGDISGLTAAYERISQIAHYMNMNNKNAKIRVFDNQSQSGLSALFVKIWQQQFPNMIEYNANSTTISIIDKTTIIVNSKTISADLINIISPQCANLMANVIGLTDESGWCPVQPASFESTMAKDIYVIGDAMKGFAGFRKNAQMANSQAKILAIVIHSLLAKNRLPKTFPPLIDSEYGMVTDQLAVSSTKIFRYKNSQWQLITDEMSEWNTQDNQNSREYMYAESWYKNITHEMFS